ncbi:lipase [Mariprofundus micogutta]|uniref:Lipase n=1 Tax=Mariprofundus micogutta TaxID=1921010 RepID=A0A1L8CQJ8_9PROT|nr:lipase family protein [Mariprofundus micogutta]GAV21191.1 lipase [Mariprofundus micogutta]
MPDLDPKPLPEDLSFQALFYPNLSYDYFANADTQPFQFDAETYQSVNAWWLAEASLLAYVQQHDFVSQKLADAGLPHYKPFEDDETHTQCFVAHNDDFAIVCFRGTEIVKQDIITDLKFLLTDSGSRGKVHKGFKIALDSVWDGISDHLNDITDYGSSPMKVWFTGHSLGAGLATLAAARYPAAQGIYTIASPRCGNREFSNAFTNRYWRFVHNNDAVCMLPPAITYRHTGNMIYIDDQGAVNSAPSFWTYLSTMIRGHFRHMGTIIKCWRRGDFTALPLDNINDHAPIYYVIHIWNDHIRRIQ